MAAIAAAIVNGVAAQVGDLPQWSAALSTNSTFVGRYTHVAVANTTHITFLGGRALDGTLQLGALVFNPATGIFVTETPLSSRIERAAIAQVDDANTVIFGGVTAAGTAVNTQFRWSQAAATLTAVTPGSRPSARQRAAALTLPNCDLAWTPCVLMYGGQVGTALTTNM